MRYKENCLQSRHATGVLGAGKPRSAPAGITAPADRQQAAKPAARRHASLKERWFDTDYLLEHVNTHFQNTFLAPRRCRSIHHLGPMCLPPSMAQNWLLAKHELSRYHEIGFDVYADLVLDTNNTYYRKMVEMTEAAVADARDKYLVGVTDIHPGADALVSMLGPEQLCLTPWNALTM